MVKYSYICTIRPTLRARHIGESVMLSSPHGNLVHFELDGDAASTLTAWYSHAATCCGEYTSVGLLFVTSKGFTRASMRLQAQAPRLTYLYKYNALITNVYLTKIGWFVTVKFPLLAEVS